MRPGLPKKEDIDDLSRSLGELSSRMEDLRGGMSEDQFRKVSRELRGMTKELTDFSELIPRLETEYKALNSRIEIAADLVSKATPGPDQIEAARALAILEERRNEVQKEYAKAVTESADKFGILRRSTLSGMAAITPSISRAAANTSTLGKVFDSISKSVLGSIPIVGTFLKVVSAIGPQGALAFAIFAEGLRRFIDLENSAKEFRKTTGLLVSQMERLRNPIRQINIELAEIGVTLKDVYDTAADLYDSFQTIHLVTEGDIKTLSQWSANIGLGTKDAAKAKSIFTGISASLGQSVNDTILFGSALAKVAGVAPAQVLKDMAEATENMLIFMARSPMYMIKSTVEARRMGTTIKSISDSARGFLNYTDSITNELSASALIGKSLNFQLARSLAYEGKVVESRKEALRIVKSVGDFTKLNAFQQQELAKAANMTVEEIIKQQNQEKMLAELRQSTRKEDIELVKKYEMAMSEVNAGQTKSLIDQGREMAKNLDRQTKIEKVTNKLKAVYLDVTDALADIVEQLWPEIEAQVKDITDILKNFAKSLRENKETIKAITALFSFFISTIGAAIKMFLTPLKDVATMVGNVILNFQELGNEVGWIGTLFNTISGTIDNLLDAVGKMIVPAATFGQHMKVAGLATQAMIVPAAKIVDLISTTAQGTEKLNRATAATSRVVSSLGAGLKDAARYVEASSRAVSAFGSSSKFITYMVAGLEKIISVGRAIGSTFANIFSGLSKFGWVAKIAGFFGKWLTPIGWIITGVELIMNIFNRFKESAEEMKNAGFWEAIWIGIKSVGLAIFDTITSPFKAAWNAISGWFGHSPSELGLLIVEGIFSVGKMLFEMLTSPYKLAWNFIQLGVEKLVDILKTPLASIWDSIKNGAQSIFNIITEPLSNIFKFVKDSAVSLASTLLDWLIAPFKNAWKWITNNIPFVGKIFGAAKDAAKSMSSAISGTIEAETKTIIEVKNLDELKTTIDRLTEAIGKLNITTSAEGSTKNETNNSAAMVAKLDELISLLRGGAIGVNIDGIMVSKALATKS